MDVLKKRKFGFDSSNLFDELDMRLPFHESDVPWRIIGGKLMFSVGSIGIDVQFSRRNC